MEHETIRASKCRPQAERGFTYIAVLIFVAIMGVWLAAVSEVWRTQLKRDQEEDLLFAGHQIRDAIAMYARQTPGGTGHYPASLEDLLKDPRFPATKRYLRKIYRDPVTNSTNWELVQGPNGELLGIHSKSEGEPLKQAGFGLLDRAFEGKTKYSDWVFVISPTIIPPQPAPAPPRASVGVPRVSRSR